MSFEGQAKSFRKFCEEPKRYPDMVMMSPSQYVKYARLAGFSEAEIRYVLETDKKKKRKLKRYLKRRIGSI